MAKARPIPNLSAEEPMALGAARILEVRTAELREHSSGVLDTSDIERLHAMRVATRRLRAALEVFETCFDRDTFGDLLAEVKSLTDALGERRDRDVAIVFLERFALELTVPDRRGVRSLTETLRIEQEDVNEALEPVVDVERIERLCEALRELAASARASVEPAVPEGAPAELRRRAIANGDGSLA